MLEHGFAPDLSEMTFLFPKALATVCAGEEHQPDLLILFLRSAKPGSGDGDVGHAMSKRTARHRHRDRGGYAFVSFGQGTLDPQLLAFRVGGIGNEATLQTGSERGVACEHGGDPAAGATFGGHEAIGSIRNTLLSRKRWALRWSTAAGDWFTVAERRA